MAFGALSIKARALRHLARREHSRAELERKLALHVQEREGEDAASAAEQIRAALDELAASGLLSDARAAEAVLVSQGRRFGSRRLKHSLLAKGLEPELITRTLEQARESELDRAREVWRRRFGQAPSHPAERARQMRFMAGRGFDGDVIRRVVRGLEED